MTAAPAAARPPLWRNRGFAAFWAAQTVSELGSRVSELALPLIAVLTLAVSPLQVGLLTAAVWAPNLIALLVGSWVDQRAHKQRVLVAADLLRAGVLLSLPVAHWLGAVTLGQLFAVALLCGVGQVLFSTAYGPFFVALVDRDRYLDANSKLSTSRSLSFIAGPALGGQLIGLLTAPVAVLVDALSFLGSALLISRVHAPASRPDSAGTPMLSNARAGLTYLLRDPYLRPALACITTVNFFNYLANALLVLFAARTLHLPAAVIGLALGVGAAGGLLGAALTPRLSARYGIGPMVIAGAVLFPLPTAAVAAAGGSTTLAAAVLAAAEFLSSAGVMLLDINLNSVQTAVILDRMRSRVTGAFTTINYGVRPAGAVLGGLLGSSIGLRPTLLLAAAGGTLAFLWLLPSPIRPLHTLDGILDPQTAAPPEEG